jgi:Spy/CpxP family protein refolding chaperone
MICALFFMAAPVFAQDQTATPPPPGGRYEQLMQRVIEVKHQKLRETLALDDATAQKFFDIYTPAEKAIGDLVKQRNQQEIKLLQLTQGDYKDADVDPTIQEIKSLNDQIEQQAFKLNDALKPVLNPRQRAKLLVFEHEFNRRVRDKIQKWRQNHAGRPFANGLKRGGATPQSRKP